MDKLLTQLETLPERLGGHVFLSMTALVVGVTLSVPLGIVALRRPSLERAALFFASIVQTIPGLALLAMMVFVWGTIGWLPALIALILYSVLPVLRNTITGLKGVDPALVEAGRGVGMSEDQILWHVLLPLALPTIVAGVRTASVWVVGAATIAQPVGATSLGNYIFVGLQTYNFTAIVVGCVLSALLALALDGLLYSAELAVRDRNRSRLALTILGGIGIAMLPLALEQLPINPAGTAQPSSSSSGQHLADGKPYVIGTKAFTEQYVLGDLIRSKLIAHGIPCELKDGMGSAIVFSALAGGEIDCYVDYSGTIWSNQMQQSSFASPVEMLVDVTSYLREEEDVICLGPLGFSNAYVFAMRNADAERLGIQSLQDLAKHDDERVVGGDIEFFDRPEWHAVQASYGIQFAREATMDAALMYGAIESKQLDVIVAYNTDSRLERYDLRVLEDPKFALPPYDAILLVSTRMARDPEAMKVLRPLIQSISDKSMRRANGLVDIDGQDVATARASLEN